MNVLILTPDRVGSTLLQRLLTIYMVRKGFGLPVINLHELSNGLTRSFNEKLGQFVLSKHKLEHMNSQQKDIWGYYQTLPEIEQLLDSVDHYKTSRLAHYHIVHRQDSIADQAKFYDYLNRNFYIISCQRENLLEHALSWVIHSHSKHLNVYSAEEKITVFADIYNHGIQATQQGLTKYLDRYLEYTNWVNRYFNVQSYFDYDTDRHSIEKYILSLDFMRGHNHNSWQDMFGQDFETWNTCHRLLPNLLLRSPGTDATQSISLSTSPITEQKWQQLRGPDWPESLQQLGHVQLPAQVDQEIKHRFNMVSVAVSPEENSFLKENLYAYQQAQANIHKLQEHGILMSGVPIKLQSLTEKKQIIQNFDQCVQWYNQWVETHGFGKPYTESALDDLARNEEALLNSTIYPMLGK